MVIMAEKTCRNMEVVLRVRPLNGREMEQNQRNIIRLADDYTIIFDPEEDEEEFFFHGAKQTHRDITKRAHKKLPMTFDRVFGNDSTNENIFDCSMKPLVTAVLDGFNCSAFVYGATGAGKTFTMLGSDDYPGITFLTMRELFRQIESNSNDRQFDIGISYLEVYNEQVMNLLTKTGPLKLREDGNGVVVGGLVLKPIYSADELLSLLALGNQNRTQHPTDANAESSRSHAIFQVHIRMTTKMTGQKRLVKLSMIDLAGSERAASTKCIGTRFKEGASINKSLLALGNCINKLADGSKHIPYRDSNMTRILKDSLGGNCKTVMIANISPSSLTYEDTYNTLKYASRAQKIRSSILTKNTIKTNLPKEYYIRKLTEQTEENERLKKRMKTLETQARSNAEPIINNNASDTSINKFIAEMAQWEQKINAIYDVMKTTQENYFSQYSKEKMLRFRMKLKEATEKAKNAFNLDSFAKDKEVAKLKASCDKFAKQIQTYQTDKQKWITRFQEASTELSTIKKEIKDERMKKLMLSYFASKQMELENLQTNLKIEHVNKINTLLYTESENMRAIQQQSNEILQQHYLLLNANMLMTLDMEAKYQQLYKAYDGNRAVTFSNEDIVRYAHEDEDMILKSNPMENMDWHVATEVAEKHNGDILPSLGPKARRALHPNPTASVLDMTQVIAKHEEGTMDCEPLHGVNATFSLGLNTVPSSLNKKPLAISRVLKDSNPNIHKDLLKGLMKKPIGIPPRPGQREKENKRFTPTRSRKSPRRMGSPSNALNKIMNINRARTKTAEPVPLKRLKDQVRPKPALK